jgi:hypothetical protein
LQGLRQYTPPEPELPLEGLRQYIPPQEPQVAAVPAQKAAKTTPNGEPWPEGIPSDYKELYERYAPFVAKILRHYNTVERNFEEMYAYVWKRLIEKDVIGLFMDSVAEKYPPHMTVPEVLAFFGITWDQWRKKQRRFHVGTPVRAKYDPNIIICHRQGQWMPTPINDGAFLLSSRKRNAERVKRGLEPLPETNGNQSMEALYNCEDIIVLRTMETMRADGTVEGPFKNQHPSDVIARVKPTKAHFQSYLAKSIYSDWANWCRTFKRKWSQDRPLYHRPENEEDAEWEANLEDPRGMRQETQTLLKEAYTLLSDSLHRGWEETDESERRDCKPVEQTEMQMFALLEDGVSLPEAVKKLKIPERVRQAVLDSISDLRERAA